MATKEKIFKKKKKIVPEPESQKDNKDLDNEDTVSKESIPVVVKSADDDNIIDNVIKQNQETKPESLTEDKEIVKDDNQSDSTSVKSKDGSGENSKEVVGGKSKDGVGRYEKKEQDKERSRSPSVFSSASNRRSSSPFSRNVVEPAQDDRTVPGSNMGSQASLRSNFSAKSKEAWSDNNEPSTSKSKIKRPKSSTSSSTLVSKLNDGNNKTKQDDTVSVRSKQSMDTEQHQNAYIPYLYARNCIKQITTDMESMKLNHIRIVHDIEKNYKDIENETQTQFNMFVLCLRQQYAGNVKTVKQVIEVHRTELNSKETYWKDLLLSLSERNNKALKDKKVLLIKHKLEIDRLVKEKEKIKTELTTMVDKSQASVVQVEKDCTEKMEKESELLKFSIDILEKQNQELRSKSEEDQSEIERLTVLLSVKPSAPIVASTADRVEAERDGINDDKPPVVLPVVVGREEHDQIEAERNQITKERSEFLEERKKMEEDRERFLEEKKSMIEDMGKLQEQISAANKNSAELEIKYASLKTNVEDSLTLQRKYHILETQYLTISALLSANIETTKTAAQENEELTKSERDMMETEKQRLQTEIEDWEKKFTQKNNRPPTQDDKPDSAKELYTSLGEVDTMVESLALKLETLDKVKTGTIPPPPHVDPVPMVITEPVIKTIEVLVPDPATLEAYKKSQEDIEELRKEISSLQDDKTVLNSQLSESHIDLLNCHTRITELEQQFIQFKQSTVSSTVPVTHSQSESKEELTELTNQLQDKSEECEKLREENEEMRKDMKKMMKRYQKLEEKLNTSSADSGVDSRLLNMVAMLVREIHNKVPTAGDKVDKQLKDIETDKNMDATDRELKLQALTLIKTGVYKTDGVQPHDNKEIENQVTELEEKIIDLESENDILKTERDQNMEKILDLERQISDMKNQIALPALDQAESSSAALSEEKSAHESTQLELETLQKQLTDIKDEYEIEKDDLENKLNSLENLSESEMKAKDEEIEELKKRCQTLEKDRLSNIPVDSAKEIQNLQATIVLLETEKKNYKSSKTTLDNKITDLEKKLQQLNQTIDTQKNKNKELETKMKAVRTEKDKTIKDLTSQLEKKEQQPSGLERKQKTFVGKQTSDKSSQELKNIKEQLLASRRENTDLNNRIKYLELEVKKLSKSDVDTATVDKQTKRHEKILKELEKKLEMEKNKNDKNQENIKTKEEEMKSLNKDNTIKSSEIQKLKEELEGLGLVAKEGVEAAVKVKSLEQDNKHLISENKILTENFNSERVLRKKYYNMVEDMKGKIRVYCRARPLSNSEKGRGNHSVLTSPDEYSINISTSRGLKEFQFDQIFMEDSSQEKVFEDTNNLIQSAVDGYNVCMFAYGQTGSGKTFTMIGDRNQQFPGIAPRAFERIFELAEENKSKFDMKVSTYMLELYNERLIDLFGKSGSEDDRLDIKKDKKGMVVIQGSLIKKASNAKELFALFEEGSKNRHVASTKMNDESSRSHLVIGIVLESTNKATGQIITGKLSLVDLAGSERVGKTGANAEQLKEAMSINKSLSALGDVISALSSEQSFIPYRNNKLTMLMQDSLGGNAKTLMFVNISPADYNQDESVISLTYASRVKLITNDASKNSDNKEIARLKSIIQKLKHGEDVEEED